MTSLPLRRLATFAVAFAAAPFVEPHARPPSSEGEAELASVVSLLSCCWLSAAYGAAGAATSSAVAGAAGMAVAYACLDTGNHAAAFAALDLVPFAAITAIGVARLWRTVRSPGWPSGQETSSP